MALDCALLTARKAQVWEFSGLGHIERRRVEAPRWRVACILAALLHDVHRVATQYSVRGPDEVWLPLREPISVFAARQPECRVRLEWRNGVQASGSAGELSWNLPLIHRMVDDAILDFLYEGDPQIVAHMYTVLSGDAAHRPSNVIRPLVEGARIRLIARNERAGGQQVPTAPSAAQDPVAGTATASATATSAESPARGDLSDEQQRAVTARSGGQAATPTANDALRALDYATQLLIKEVQRTLARPKGAKGQVQLRNDGRLRLRREWIVSLGFDPQHMISRLDKGGWISIPNGSDPDEGEDAIVLNERVSGLLLGQRAKGDLLSGAAAPAHSAS
jgi:hypothetical protein